MGEEDGRTLFQGYGAIGADEPPQRARAHRGQHDVLREHVDLGGLLVDAEIQRALPEQRQGGGGVELAGEVMPDIGRGRLQVTPVDGALDGQGGFQEIVVVGLVRPVGPGQPARGGHILGVVGVQVLDCGRQGGCPVVAELAPQGHPAAFPRGLVHIAEAQVDVVQVAALHLVIAHGPQGGPVAQQGQVDHGLQLLAGGAGIRPGVEAGEGGLEHAELGLAGDDPIDPGHGAGPVEGALRPPHDFHSRHVGQPQVRVRGVVGDGGFVEIGADRGAGTAGEGAVGEPAQQDLVAARAQIGDGHPSHLVHRACGVHRPGGLQLPAADHAYRGWDPVGHVHALGGGDQHLGDGWRARVDVGRLGEGPRRGRRQDRRWTGEGGDPHGARIENVEPAGAGGQPLQALPHRIEAVETRAAAGAIGHAANGDVRLDGERDQRLGRRLGGDLESALQGRRPAGDRQAQGRDNAERRGATEGA